MADESMISPRAFSSCELVVKIDDNELNIPINFSMSDSEVRKLYPHLLKIARIDDNPMTQFLAKKESGELNNLTDEEYEALLSKTEKLARYWYGKPTSSLLDVGIGIAIDLAIRDGKIDIESLIDKNAEIDTMYDMSVSARDADSVSSAEADRIERRYNLKSDKDGALTLRDEIKSHDAVGGDIFDLYGDGGAYDFVSDKLAELEKKHGIDRLTEILSNDKFVQDTYASEYDPTKPLDMNQVNSNGLMDIYGENTHSVFDDLDKEESVTVDENEDEYPSGENEYELASSVDDAMADLIGDEDDDDEPWYDNSDEELPPADLDENIDDDDDEGV